MPNSAFKRRDLPEILPIGRGGTGTDDGSITGSDHLVFTPALNKMVKLNGDTEFLGNLLPDLTDTRSIGSSVKWFKDQFVSQINATIFAEQTISLVGGWMVIGKNQVKLPAVTAVQTQIDFGTLMYPGDFIVVKAHDSGNNIKTEYMQIGTLVSGTTYNVTRDIAAMHITDPVWTDGTPGLVLGTVGDGRIEFNAYDTPRISVMTQGAAYNLQTEVIRLGDLNGIGGIATQKFGIYVGTANNHMQYNATDDSLIVTGTIKASAGYIGGVSSGWAIGSNILSGGSGATYIGLDQANSKIRIGAKTSLTDANTGVHLGSDGLALGASSVFVVTAAGALTATSATITGAITATSGTIGGFTVNSTEGLYAGTGATRVQMKTGAGFWAGADARDSAPFRVTQAGVLTATSATIIGSVTASSGSIGGFTIATNLTTGSKAAYNDANAGIFIGATGIGLGPAATGFYVSAAGALTATGATISGAITATSGTFTGVVNANTGYLGGATNYWSITAGLLTSVGTASIVMGTASSTIKIGAATTIDLGAGIFMDGNGNFRAGTATAGTDFIKATTTALTIKASTFDLSTATLKITSAPSISLGTTPPTSATVGTGIWINATGIYGLSANTQNFILSATDGSVTAISGTIGGWTLNSNYLRATNGGTYGTNLVNIMLNKVTHGSDSATATPGGLQGFHITGYENTSGATGFRVGMGKIGSGHFYTTTEIADYYGIEGLYSTNPSSWSTSVMFRLAFRVTDGAIDAQIAGWKFDAGKLYNVGASGTFTGLQSSATGTTKAFFTGATDAIGTSAKAYINVDGSGALSNGAIAWDNAGNITAVNKITAGSGTIANWNITASSIQTGAFDTVSTMYFGSSGISLSNTFKVTAAGALTATSATITGIITANTGYIGGSTNGWQILAGEIRAIGTGKFTTSSTTTRVEVDSTGLKAYNAGTQRVQILSDGSGWLGSSSDFSWTNAGVLSVNKITATSGSIAGWLIDTTKIYNTNISISNATLAAASGDIILSGGDAKIHVGTGVHLDGATAGVVLLGAATSISAGNGIFIGGDGTFRAGNAAASRLLWDGTNVEIYNSANSKVVSLGGTNTIAGWTVDTEKIYKQGTGVLVATYEGYIGLNTVNSGSGYFYNGGQKLLGLHLGSNQSGEAYAIVFGQMMASGNTLKTGYYGIQMMSSSSNEIFALGMNSTVSGGMYNRIAGWTFDSTKIHNATGTTDGTAYTTTGMVLGSSGYIASPKFRVTAAGIVYATEANISGVITATSGTFTGTVNASGGNFTGNVTIGTHTDKITIAATAANTTTAIYAGTGTYGNTDTGFFMDASGRFSLKDKLTWDGTTLTINGGGTFSGALSAASGSFAGSLSAVTGTLGALTVNGILTLGTGTIASTNFNVTSTGVVTATGATVTGTLNASAGTFSGNILVSGVLQTSATASVGLKLSSAGIKAYGTGSVQTAEINADGSGFFGPSTAKVISWTAAGVATIAGWTVSNTKITSGTTYLANTSEFWASQTTRLTLAHNHVFGTSNHSYTGTGSASSTGVYFGVSPNSYWKLITNTAELAWSRVTSPELTVVAATSYVFEIGLYKPTSTPSASVVVEILNASDVVLYSSVVQLPINSYTGSYKIAYRPAITSIKIRFTMNTSEEACEVRILTLAIKSVLPFVELSEKGLFIYTDPDNMTKLGADMIDISSIRNTFYFDVNSINSAFDYVNFGIKSKTSAYNEKYHIDASNYTHPGLTILGNGGDNTYASMRIYSTDSTYGHALLILERSNKNRLSAIIHKNGVSQYNTQWVVGTGLANGGNTSMGWGVSKTINLADVKLFVSRGGSHGTDGFIGLGHNVPTNRLTLYGGTTAAQGIGFSTGSVSTAADTVLYRGAAGQLVLEGTDSDLVLNSPTSTVRSQVTFKDNGTTKALFGVAFATDSIVYGSADGDFCVRTQGGKILFSTDSGSTSALTISSGIITKATGLCRFRGSGLSSPPSTPEDGDIYIDDTTAVYIYDASSVGWTVIG